MVQALGSALAHWRLRHAYLFTGTRGAWSRHHLADSGKSTELPC
jgi:hypothetical protein